MENTTKINQEAKITASNIWNYIEEYDELTPEEWEAIPTQEDIDRLYDYLPDDVVRNWK